MPYPEDLALPGNSPAEMLGVGEDRAFDDYVAAYLQNQQPGPPQSRGFLDRLAVGLQSYRPPEGGGGGFGPAFVSGAVQSFSASRLKALEEKQGREALNLQASRAARLLASHQHYLRAQEKRKAAEEAASFEQQQATRARFRGTPTPALTADQAAEKAGKVETARIEARKKAGVPVGPQGRPSSLVEVRKKDGTVIRVPPGSSLRKNYEMTGFADSTYQKPQRPTARGHENSVDSIETALNAVSRNDSTAFRSIQKRLQGMPEEVGSDPRVRKAYMDAKRRAGLGR